MPRAIVAGSPAAPVGSLSSMSISTGRVGADDSWSDCDQGGRTRTPSASSPMSRRPSASSSGEAGRWMVRSCVTSVQGPRPKQEDRQRRVLSLQPMVLPEQLCLERLCLLWVEWHSMALPQQLNLLRNNRDSCKLLHLQLGSYLL